MSPSSIRYPLQAPPASSHDGDLPSTVIRIVTINSSSASPPASAVARRASPCPGRVPQAAFAAGSSRCWRTSSAGWRGGTRPSALFGRKVEQGSSRSSAQSIWQWKKQSSQLGRPLRRLACSALGDPDCLRHLPGLLLDLDHSLPLSRCHRSAAIMPPRGAPRRAHSRNPRLFEERPAARFPGLCGKLRGSSVASGALGRPARSLVTPRSVAALKIGADGTRAHRAAERLTSAVPEPPPRPLLEDPPLGAGDHLRARGRRRGVAGRRPRLRRRSRSCCWSRSGC